MYPCLRVRCLAVVSMPSVSVSLFSLAHELRVSCMERKKVEIQTSDPSALASDRFNFILVSERHLWVSGMA